MGFPVASSIQWVPGVKLKRRKADNSSPANAYTRPVSGQENAHLYLHSPLRLHGVVLNQLSAGTALVCTQM
jgi:hypothetical protein